MGLSEVMVYMIKVMAIQGVFYFFYWLFLQNKISHTLNRTYLLTTIIGSFVIPFISIPVASISQPLVESEMFVWIAAPIGEGIQSSLASSDSSIRFWSILTWIYILMMVFLIGRSSLHLIILQKLKSHSEYVKKYWFKLFKTTQSRPFSFFSSVFIPVDIFGTKSFEQIVAHECVHVRQLHSLDRLLIDFFVALFWFNPFIYLYRRALIEVHEYQADSTVVNQFDDLIGYQEILYSQLRSAPYSGLVSHFNFSTIKKRIVMMNKSKTKKQSTVAYFFTVPVMALVLFAFTSKEGDESANHIAEKIEEITAPFESEWIETEMLILQEDQYKPSILPLKSTAEFIVSSAFGWRIDPIKYNRRMHKGLDLATASGTEVVATADGIVEEVSTDAKGHGKMLILKHGDMFKTKYAQLSEFKVSNGERVSKGQVIALSGNSGKSTGPHLHYEVLEDGKHKNPMDYIKNFKFKVMIEETSPPPSMDEEEERTLIEISEVVKQQEVLKVQMIESIKEVDLISDEIKRETAVSKKQAFEAKVLAEKATVLAEEMKVLASEHAKEAAKAAIVASQKVRVDITAKEIAEIKAQLAEKERVLAEDQKLIVIKEKLVIEMKKQEEVAKKLKEKEKKKDKNKE
ncbi:MAG: peptidoglycan DD-metalloendopeptidase family protein [Cytophagales bacterium]|nr:peptidoglycan DD-metalloendopeptidase family protein [Cytophagales bacterium]